MRKCAYQKQKIKFKKVWPVASMVGGRTIFGSVGRGLLFSFGSVRGSGLETMRDIQATLLPKLFTTRMSFSAAPLQTPSPHHPSRCHLRHSSCSILSKCVALHMRVCAAVLVCVRLLCLLYDLLL